MEGSTMKKIYMLIATAGILLALAGPDLAASRSQSTSGYDNVNMVRADGDRDTNKPSGARHLGYDAYARDMTIGRYRGAPLQTSPYPNLPHHAPNVW
jgi:hypothetical protein